MWTITAAALRRLLDDQVTEGVFHIGSGWRLTNLELVSEVVRALNRWAGERGYDLTRPRLEMVADRPGHDRRYALDSTKIARELNWNCAIDFREGLDRTVAWLAEDNCAARVSG